MTYIVMIKRGETSFGFSCGSGSEAVAMALRLLRNGDVDVSITSPRGVTYKPAGFRQLISKIVEVDHIGPACPPDVSPIRYEPFGKSHLNQHARRH
ncbi:MAG: hypothetical protein WBS22_00805 [Methylocystis sp.]